MKNWKITLACPRGEVVDNKRIEVTGESEIEALLKVDNLPSSEVHCVHGPLKAVDLQPVSDSSKN